MEFCIFCAKSRQNERSSVVYSLNVNKLSREFFHDFFGEKSRQNEWSLNVNKVSRFFTDFLMKLQKRHLVVNTVMKSIKVERYL